MSNLSAELNQIRLRVSSNEYFRREAAAMIVEEADPSFHGIGYYYADPVEGRVYYRESQGWNTWCDDVDWRVVSVQDLVSDGCDGCDFSPSVDWDAAEADIPYAEMVDAYLEAQGEKRESNGEIPEWVCKSDVIAFASEDDRWKELIQSIEEAYKEVSVQFALSELKDEIVIDGPVE